MAVDEFKVRILAELDTSKINTAGSNFGKMASKHMGGANSVSNKGGGMLSSMTQTLKGMTSGKGGDIVGSLSKHLGSKAPMLLKLGVIGGILLAVFNVLKSLAPIVGILKLVETVLKLTLYPIAMFLLNIFKPILFLLLKYVIIPIGEYFGLWKTKDPITKDPKLEGLKPIIGGMDVLGITLLNEWLKGFVPGFLKFVDDITADWNRWLNRMDADFRRWLSETWSNLSVWWYDIKTGFSTWFSDITGKFNEIVANVLNISWSDITSKFSEMKNNITNISWSDITGKFNEMKNNIINISWSDITGKFNEMKNNIVGISWNDITNIWVDIKTGIVNIFNGIVDTINSIFARIKWPSMPSWLGGGGGSSQGSGSGGGGGGGARDESSGTYTIPGPGGTTIIRKYATGGIAMTPQIASIAEKGPEIFLPLDKLRDLVGGGTNTVTINIAKIEKEVDIDSLVSKLERILYSNNKRSGAF